MKSDQKILGATLLTLVSMAEHVNGAPAIPPEVADISYDACASRPVPEYNMNLHIASIFIVVCSSSIGVFWPMALHQYKRGKSSRFCDAILNVGKFFGTGVILATAFIHILPGAFAQFSNPCLTGVWSQYGAWAGAFCMISAFLIQIIEFTAIANAENLIAKRYASSDNDSSKVGITQEERAYQYHHHPHHYHPQDHCHHENSDDSDNDTQITMPVHSHIAGLLDAEYNFKDIGTLILELGITLHSIIMGITLSNTGGGEFLSLLIALTFHQFFEGMALGARINELKHSRFLYSFVMGIIYVIITPSGIILGMGIQSSYNPNSTTAVLTVGILDSLSAGVLLYNAFVELIAMEMNHNPSFRRKSLLTKILCFISMYTGAFAMALVGHWA